MRCLTLALSTTLALTAAAHASSIAAQINELRHGFTLDHKPIPPEVLGDLGASDIADSISIRVTIDLIAALGSNLYADEITTTPNGWVSQKKVTSTAATKLTEEVSYAFNGSTSNGLLVVTTAYSGGGSGDFFALNLLEASAGRGFDAEGKSYARLNLTIVRSIPLGDRWEGEIKIDGETISIFASRQGFNHGPTRPRVQTIKAVRP